MGECKVAYTFLLRDSGKRNNGDIVFAFYIDNKDFVLKKSIIFCLLDGNKNFELDDDDTHRKISEENGYYKINLFIHSAKDILKGQTPITPQSDQFAQEQFKGEGVKANDPKFPAIHIPLTDLFIDSLYGDGNLPTIIPRSFQIMDSSIWNYLVPIYDIKYKDADGNVKEVERYEKSFYNAVVSIYRNYEKHLYDLHVAKEYADLNARLVNESYLAGSHASGVSPFIFHSETVIKKLIKEEFGSNPSINVFSTMQRIKNRKWRILLVDDKAKSRMEHDWQEEKDEEIDNLPWNCKLTIIKQLLEKQFGLVDRSDPLLDITIPYRHFNQLGFYKKDDELYLEFEKPVDEKELEVIKERILALPLFSKKKITIVEIENISHLPMSFELLSSDKDILYISNEQSGNEVAERKEITARKVIAAPFKVIELIKMIKDKVWAVLTGKNAKIIKNLDFELADINLLDERKSYLLRVYFSCVAKDEDVKKVTGLLEHKIRDINERKKDIILDINQIKVEQPDKSTTVVYYKLVYKGIVYKEIIQTVEKELKSTDFHLSPYCGVKLSRSQTWDKESITEFERQLRDKFEMPVIIEDRTPFVIEYAETEKDAENALKLKKYDVILLDYLLKDNSENHYGYELLEDISKHAKDDTYKLGKGPNGKFFFLFISAYSSAIYERLLAEGLNQTEDYWQISIGACPTNTPQLFLYNLIKLMENRLEHTGIEKLSTRKIYELVESIYHPKEGAVRKNANNMYQEVLSLQYHYRKMLADVDIPNGDSVFDTKGSVLITDFIRKNVNLGGMLEHLNHLVHLTAFGTIRQWPEMWEEFIYFKGQFKAQNDIVGGESITSKEYDDMTTHIENFIKTLKSQ